MCWGIMCLVGFRRVALSAGRRPVAVAKKMPSKCIQNVFFFNPLGYLFILYVALTLNPKSRLQNSGPKPKIPCLKANLRAQESYALPAVDPSWGEGRGSAWRFVTGFAWSREQKGQTIQTISNIFAECILGSHHLVLFLAVPARV